MNDKIFSTLTLDQSGLSYHKGADPPTNFEVCCGITKEKGDKIEKFKSIKLVY